MVGSVVDGVHANSVDAQLLELLDIALAAINVGNGVLSIRGAAGLVVNTADVETLVAGPEGCNWELAWLFERVIRCTSRTIALDGDLGDAAGAGGGAGLSPGRDLDRSGGGVGEGSRSRGDSNSALHGCGK